MRIRSIKPEFWRSDDITALSREHRLLFVGLWSYVDDNGVGIDDYRQIAADLFALEDDQKEVRDYVRDGLDVLERQLLIARYAVAGKRYLFVRSWARHQRIDKPGKARFPLPPEDWKPPTCGDDPGRDGSRESRESVARVSTSLDTGSNSADRRISGESGNADSGRAELAETGSSTSAPSEQGERESSRDPRETIAPGTGEQRNRGTTTSRTAGADAGERDRQFEEFWDAYPRKKDKIDARKAWNAAIRKRVDPARLTQAAASYRQTITELHYAKYPAAWLRAGSYDNEPEPQPGRHLASVPDSGWFDEETVYADLLDRADAREAARLIGASWVEDPKPPSDPMSSVEWSRARRREFIEAHADRIRAALTERKTG